MESQICPHADEESCGLCRKCSGWCRHCKAGIIGDFIAHMRQHEPAGGQSDNLAAPRSNSRSNNRSGDGSMAIHVVPY